jgi:hypothetical protein
MWVSFPMLEALPRCVSVSIALIWGWQLSLGKKSLHLELDLWYDGVLDIVSLLEVSCLETQLGGSMWRSSGACHCPRLIFKGAMYAIASEFKTMAFLGPTKTRHLLVVSFTPQG